jgi:uncharacterized damage-inducible protein DinB
MNTISKLRSEFDHEAQTTRKHLERLPDDKFDWRPHQKSYTAVQLASHIVECLGWGEPVFKQKEIDFDFATYKPYQASSKDELLKTFEENVKSCQQAMADANDAILEQPWQLKVNGKTWFEKPKEAVFRDFVLSHVIHHRGQYSVYLRLLEVPVPGSYGPSADESPPPELRE